jgi:hypothetical protein
MASPSQPLVSDSPLKAHTNSLPMIVHAPKGPNIDGKAYQRHLSLPEAGALRLQDPDIIEQMNPSIADVDAFVYLLTSIVRRILLSDLPPTASEPRSIP